MSAPMDAAALRDDMSATDRLIADLFATVDSHNAQVLALAKFAGDVLDAVFGDEKEGTTAADVLTEIKRFRREVDRVVKCSGCGHDKGVHLYCKTEGCKESLAYKQRAAMARRASQSLYHHGGGAA